MTATLVSVFNHRFDQNIPLLRDLYRDRFTEHRFLVPHYDGESADVIPVWGNPHRFPSFYAQAAGVLLDASAETFIFCHDDLVLRPSLNEQNLDEQLGLAPDACFIKQIRTLEDMGAGWALQNGSLLWPRRTPSNAWRAQAPEARDFRRVVTEAASAGRTSVSLGDLMKVLRGSLQLRHAWQEAYAYRHLLRILLSYPEGFQADYPLAAGYSDFIVVRRSNLVEFARWCDRLSSLDLFAEVAAPTALLLSGAKVTTESHAQGEGREFWEPEGAQAFGEKYGWNLTNLSKNFPEETLWVHPVKLSQWTT